MKRAIFILGMHRSGTSALARVVNLLGAELGASLMAAAEDNPRGFWEHEAAVQIHEALLQSLGHGWEDGTPLPQNWQASDAAKEASAKLAELIDSEFADASLWAIKDPRLSLLFPLWEPLLKERGIAPHCIVAWRNPVEVAASLHKRDELEEEEVLLCWLAYTLESLRYAQSHPHAIVSYDALLQDWQGAVQKLAGDLQIEWPMKAEEAAVQVEEFLSSDLRHHQQPLPEGESPVLEMVRECLGYLEQPESAGLDALHSRWHSYTQAFAPALRRVRLANQARQQALDATRKDAARFEHRAEDIQQQFVQLQQSHETIVPQLTQERDILQAKLSRLLASTSWKVTRPLRQAKAVLQGSKGEGE